MRISICNFSKLKALCKIFEKTLHGERPFRVVNGLDRDQSRLISRTPAILLWELSQESLDNISLISRLNQQVEWGYKRNKKERRCWYCSKITPIFCPGNGPSCPYWYDLPILLNSMQKTSSLSKSWLENKMKQMGPRRDKLHKILLHSMPIRLFQRSCAW